MTIDWVRGVCLGFPHATENVQWGGDLVFKVAGKMFAVAALEPVGHWVSFKCSPDEFARLVELPGVVPAPYLARAQWVALESRDAVAPGELADLLRRSYDLVVAKLPKKVRAELGRH
jgi:predicted DNA-binding protein (MmcQ/YjbR family)